MAWKPAASIWFEIWGSLIRVNNIFFRQLHKKIRFSLANFWKQIFFQATLRKITIFRQIFKRFRFCQAVFKKLRFSRQKLLIYSYFWTDSSISLQKSPLSNILSVHLYFRFQSTLKQSMSPAHANVNLRDYHIIHFCTGPFLLLIKL